MPYCSSALYVGTRDASDINGYYFHGKYIVKVSVNQCDGVCRDDIGAGGGEGEAKVKVLQVNFNTAAWKSIKNLKLN